MQEKSATALDIFGLAAPVLLSGKPPNWVPTVDEDLIPGLARDLWQEAPADYDLLIGNTRDDGASFILLNFLGYPVGDLLNLAKNKNLLLSLLR